MPGDLDAFRYFESGSDGMPVLCFEQPQGGIPAHSMARWATRRGANGAWSETGSAMVAA